MTNWVAVPGRSSKSLPKMKFATKKVMIPVWWSAAGMKHYNFLKWSESCSVVSYSLWLHGLYSPLNSPGQNTGVGSLSLPQGIFPTQGWNKSLRHCRKIIYQLSHKGSSQLSESWQNHYIWEVCSANWWDTPKTTTPAAGLNQKKGHNTSWQYLTTHHTDQASKVNELGYEILPHPYLPELLTSDYQFFKHLDNFLQGKCFHNHQEAEKAFQELIKS